MGKMSVATISSPEFLNITSISPLISKCEIKVMYVGENRNHSMITKEVATQMAQTLRGVPIVGYWSDSKEDFLDHGERIEIDGEGVKIKDMTKPYGFIAPNAKVWFKEFEDTDEFGNKEIRNYLMTEGYLWTEQYEECKRIMTEGNPQSMKLWNKDDSLKGYWSTDLNKGVDFFIINDAIFENLCILGEEVEPCFEGADITEPKLSTNFSKDEGFVRTLFSMMEELKEVLSNKGGTPMEENMNAETEVLEQETFTAEAESQTTEEQATPAENFENSVDNSNEEETNEIDNSTEEFTATQNDNTEVETTETFSETSTVEEETVTTPEVNEYQVKCESLEAELSALQEKYNELETQYSTLVDFKNKIDEEKKDALINSFYMLSDEDKKEVIENKASYSLDEIEAKLSVICFRKKVSFDLEEETTDKNVDSATTTFNLSSVETEQVPAYILAMRNAKKA